LTDLDWILKRQLSRTENGLMSDFEVCVQHPDSEECKQRAIKIIKKMQTKGWIKTWFYEFKMLPYLKENDKSWFEQWSKIIHDL